MRRARFFLKVWRRASASILFFPLSLAWGYRLSATDAAVAEPEEMEIELGYFTLERDRGKKTFIIPKVVFTYGVIETLKSWVNFALKNLRAVLSGLRTLRYR